MLDALRLQWAAECQNPRPQVPPEVIQAARLEVREAGEQLQNVEAELTQ
ncbi:MAG: hypothetical protein HC915_02515 [Anaerolineae bacterium]|nr:hypothetical protein [Anaerolineae bacterium]